MAGVGHHDVELGRLGLLPEHVFESGAQSEVASTVVLGEVPGSVPQIEEGDHTVRLLTAGQFHVMCFILFPHPIPKPLRWIMDVILIHSLDVSSASFFVDVVFYILRNEGSLAGQRNKIGKQFRRIECNNFIGWIIN